MKFGMPDEIFMNYHILFGDTESRLLKPNENCSILSTLESDEHETSMKNAIVKHYTYLRPRES